MLIWAAMVPYIQLPSAEALAHVSLATFGNLPWPLVRRGLTNTLILSIAGPSLALAWSVVFSWVVLRWRHRLRLAFDFVAFLPHAVPGLIFALGALLIALFWLRALYGSVELILIVYVITQLAFGTRMTNSALIQVHTELEEAARISGASTSAVLNRVIVPLISPALIYAWLWMALFSFRELTIATMLVSAQNITLPVVVWSLLYGGRTPQAAAVAVLMIVLFVPLVLLYMRLGGRRAFQPA